jgi:putative ABC transport system permease protein
LESLSRDLLYAFRQLRKSPSFTLTAVITLALGIGATAAVYSVIHTVLLQPLPYPEPECLVGIAFTFPGEKPNAEQAGAAADFVRGHSQAFSSTVLMDDSATAVNLSIHGGHAVQVRALRVSEGYFRTLGIMPVVGRGFSPEEDRSGGAGAVVLSNGLWMRLFHGNPDILGQEIRLNQEMFTVVGIMPAAFASADATAPGVTGTPDLWQPLKLSPNDPGYDGDNYKMIARLRPGITLNQAQQQLNALQQSFYTQFASFKQWRNQSNQAHEFRVWKLQDVVVSEVRHSLLTAMGAVVAVLLVACLNLAGLIMARAMQRSREIGLRSALGATSVQLVRLMACEGFLLAIIGGYFAALIAKVSVPLLLYASPLAIPQLHGQPDKWLLSVVVLLVALASTCIFSMVPAWIILCRRNRGLRLGGLSLGETVSHARIARALIVAQVALTMVLVSTASVLLGTFVRIHSLPSGVEPKQLTVVQVALKGNHYANTGATSRFVETVLDRLSQLPGVDRVAAVNGLPLDRGLNQGGYPADRPQLRQIIQFRSVSSDYFQTMGIHLLSGRLFTRDDNGFSEPIVLISETAARSWWPGHSPIGEFINLGNEDRRRIIGVIADVQTRSLVESHGIVIYAPIAQLSDKTTAIINGWFPTSFAIRTSANVNLVASIQQAVEGADPEIPVTHFTTMQSVIDSTIEGPRFFSQIAGGFSLFALALTVFGLFGLLSYQLTQRTREIGLRMALGADQLVISRAFVGRSLVLTSTGVALGLLSNCWMRPVITSLLSDVGVNPAGNGPAVVMNEGIAAALAVVTLLCAALAASWLPAYRAASVEPIQALHTE